jgi:hypothetical protein
VRTVRTGRGIVGAQENGMNCKVQRRRIEMGRTRMYWSIGKLVLAVSVLSCSDAYCSLLLRVL